MDHLPTGRLANVPKARQYEGSPALFIENESIESDPAFQLLTISEVASVLKISQSGVRRLQQQRCIPFLKVGGSVRFAKSDIVAYLARIRVETIE